MSFKKFTRSHIITLISLLGLALLLLWPTLVTALPLTPQHQLERAWQLAAETGRYDYDSTVFQTSRPTARLENAGSQPSIQPLRAQGSLDRANDAMHLRLWSPGTGKQGIELKIEDGVALGRTSTEEAWNELPNPTSLFAPGGDPMGFLSAADNVKQMKNDELRMKNGDPTTPIFNSSFLIFTFEINGPRYANFIRQQMETTLREQGDLPPGINMGLSRQFVEMTGQGEIWLNEAGLPVYQVIALKFPPERGAMESVEVEISTSFSGWEGVTSVKSQVSSAECQLSGIGCQVSRITAHLSAFIENSPFTIHHSPFFSLNSLRTFGISLGIALLFLACTLFLIRHHRSPHLYRLMALSVILSMLITPLLQSRQVYAFSHQQQQRQAEFEQERVAVNQEDAARREMRDLGYNPMVNQLADDSGDSSDSAIQDSPFAIRNSQLTIPAQPICDINTDSDGDGLSDYVECYKLDTYTNTIDSDSDGISDLTEVQGFSWKGRKWYLDPLNPDSNKDGLTDAMECPGQVDVDENGNLSSPQSLTCRDTDGDKAPDVFDFDNDGDGVPDRIDVSPNYRGDLSQNLQSDFEFNLDGFDGSDRSVVVEFQLRPSDSKYLYQTNNVFDWPSNDTNGQINRVYDTTLHDFGMAGTKTKNGDMILAPMLEIIIPNPAENSDNPAGGLPVKAGFDTGLIATSPLTAWLDSTALDNYNISVSQNVLDDKLYAYIPLSVIQDTTADTPVAWGAQMLYQPDGALWGDDHQVKMVWLVQALVDTCDTGAMGEDDDYDVWCAADSDNWTSALTVIQTYYEDFSLTGLKVREDYGLDIALLAQNDALSVDYENHLWHLASNLEATFAAGLQIDDNNDGVGDRRFDLTEIITRFGAGSGTEWDIPLNNITLDSASYSDQTSGLATLAITQTPSLLNNLYSGASGGDNVTLLIAREDTYKTTVLGSDNVDDSVLGSLSVSLGGLSQQTYATLNWSPYQYDDVSGEWLSMDLYERLEKLEADLNQALSVDEMSNMLSWFDEEGEINEHVRKGIIGMARNFYMSMYMGFSNVVDDTVYGVTNPGIVIEEEMGMVYNGLHQAAESALLIVAGGVSLMQYFFQQEDEPLLDEVYEILVTLGEIEVDLEGNDLLTQEVIIAGISGTKSMIKKTLKWYISGGTKFYNGRSTLRSTYNYMGYTAVGLTIVNEAFFGGKNSALSITAESLTLATTAIDAFDTAYVYYAVILNGSDDIITYTQTANTLQTSTKISAVVGFIADVGIAATIFAFSIKNAPPGSLAFNMALAEFIVAIVVAVIVAIIAATLVGAIVLAIIGLIDAAIAAICRWNGQKESAAVKTWVCGGIRGAFTTALRYFTYDQQVLVDLDKDSLRDIQLRTPTLANLTGTDGYVQGNELEFNATITTTLTLDKPAKGSVIDNSYTNSQLQKLMRRSTYEYRFQNQAIDFHKSLGKDEVNWGSDNQHSFNLTTPFTMPSAGVNHVFSLYLSEGFVANAIECAGLVGANEDWTCFQDKVDDTIHIFLGDTFTIDILPNNLDGFINAAAVEKESYRLSWDDKFPILADADGDGLRSKARGGPDPDDNSPDTDGDGLTDFWELDNGFDPRAADGDGDGLYDYWEAFYWTNPYQADTDNDGLPDGAEFYHSQSRHPFQADSQAWTGGWNISYPSLNGQNKTAWVSADALSYDSDTDTISDWREQIYGYNPNIPSVLNILTLDSEVDSSAVQSGGTVAYTTTIKNELDGRAMNGLLQSEMPVDNVLNTEVIQTLGPLDIITMTGSVNVATVSQSTPTSLTLRAGVVVSAAAVVDTTPPGPVFLLNEFKPGFNPSNGYNQTDASGYNHTVECPANIYVYQCPTEESALLNDGLSFGQYDRINVSGQNSLKLGSNDNTFSMMLWLNPGENYSPDDRHFAEFGRTILGQNYYDTPNNDFPSLTLVKSSINGSSARIQVHFGHSNGLGHCVANSNHFILFDEWQHIAVVFDGSTFFFYKNGVLQSESNGTNCAGKDLYPARNFTIGHNNGVAAYFKRMIPKQASFDEGYIWSDDNHTYINETYSFNRFNHYHYNPQNEAEMIWYPGVNHIHKNDWGDEVNYSLENWAVSGKRTLTFWMCNMDEVDEGYPLGCLDTDNNSDEPLYYKKNGNKEYEVTYLSVDTPGEYVLDYDKGYKNNKWGGPLTYVIYNNAFKGTLDELAIYNTNLSATNVEDAYLSDLRVANLTFDEPPGQSVFEDATAYDVVATCSSPNCPDSGIPGRDNQALRFDGNAYVDFPQPLNPDAANFTASAWFKMDDVNGNQRILQQLDGTGTGRNWLGVVNGQLRSNLGGSAVNSPANAVSAGQWYHAAVSSNGTVVKLYLNGSLVAEETRNVEASDGALRIGAGKGGGNDNPFNGLIDEVVVQRGELTESSVQRLLLEAPILNLHLDENLNAGTFSDDTPYGNNATCTGNACPAAGTKGLMREAISLDGGNDVLNVDLSNTNLDKANMTIAMWVRPDRIQSVEQTLLDMDEFRLYIPANSTKVKVYFKTDSYSISCDDTTILDSGQTTLALNQWNHIAFTVNQAAKNSSSRYPLTLYINGSIAAQKYTPNRGDPCINITDTPIFGQKVAGNLDEVTMYSAALRQSEIRDLFDYQSAWFDQTYVHDIMIDVDNPQVSLALATEYLDLNERLLAIEAVDVSSAIASVQVTLTPPGGGNSVSYALRSEDPASKAWFYNFNPSVAGEYTINLLATDMAGNTATSSHTIYVDDTPPTATLDGSLSSGIHKTTIAGDDTHSFNLFGTVTDPGSPASGVATNTISVDVLDRQNASVGGAQSATTSPPAQGGTEGGWSLNYPFSEPPYGVYDVHLNAKDAVGNTFTGTLGSISLDSLAPSADLTWAGTLLTDTNDVLLGTASAIPYPLQSKRLVLHFEEANGATQFVDSTRDHHLALCQSDCPTAGQTGQYGQAVSFDGANDVLTAPSTINPISDTFTALAWFNLDDTSGTYTLLGQESGASWLSVLPGGQVNSALGGSNLGSPSAISAGQWHHTAVSYDGSQLRLYVDGTLVISDSRSLASNENSLVIGADGSFANLFKGRLDELVIYDNALTDEQIYDIANPLNTGVASAQIRFRHVQDNAQSEDEGDWYNVSLANPGQNYSAWSFAPPEDLEGPYKIDLRVTNTLSNSGFYPNVWNGNIDLAAPRLSFDYDILGYDYVRVQCYAYDFNIDGETWDCPAPDKTGISEDSAWFQETFTDSVKITAYDSGLENVQTASNSFTACDIFGHCATQTITNPTQLQQAVAIITPTATAVLTGLQAIEISGYARSHLYVDSVELFIDGQSIHREEYWLLTQTTFSTMWMPETVGTFTLEAVMVPRLGHRSVVDPVDHTITITGPVLSIAKTQTPLGLNVNDAVTYTVVVSNNGNMPASNVQITDTLPSYLAGPDLDETVSLNIGEAVTYTIPAVVSDTFIAVINTAWVSDTWQRESSIAYDFRCDRFEVFNPADSGPGSLRHAIDNACDGSLITFAGDMTINIESKMTVDGINITIDGEDNNVIINGRSDYAFRNIFQVNDNAGLTIRNLILERGVPAINSQGSLSVYTTTFRYNANRAINHDSDANLLVRDSYFDANYLSQGSGGAIRLNGSGNATISHSLFRFNRARIAGGAIYNNGATLRVENSTFTLNTTDYVYGGGAGAIYLNSGPAEIVHNTFYRNSTKAHSSKPAFTADVHHQASESLLLANNILANKDRGRHCSTAGNGTLTSVNNLIEDGTCNATFTSEAKLFSLSQYGGLYKSFAPKATSPALDAADPAYCLSDDQRGFARPHGSACDLGAVEGGYDFVIEGANQSASINTSFSQPLSLTLYHQGTSISPNQKSKLIVSGPDSGASLSPASWSEYSDNQGHYTATLSANSLSGTYPVTLSIQNSTQYTVFNLSNTAADLGVSKTMSPLIPMPNIPVTYTISFSNTGTEIASNIVITDEVPNKVTISGIISQSDVTLSHSTNSGDEIFSAVSLAPGQGGIITLTGSFNANVNVAEEIINTVSIGSDISDGNPANDTASVSGKVACYNTSLLYVDTDAVGAATGLTWTDAFTNPQDALDSARDCGYATEIWVAEGIYYPNEGLSYNQNNRNASFTLVNGVGLYGGFSGGETLRSQRNYTTNLTILSGDMAQNDGTDSNGVVTDTANILSNNSRHVVKASDVDGSTVLDGFTITAGEATGSNSSSGGYHNRYGGGLYVRNATPTLANLNFSGNFAQSLGGAMYVTNGNLDLSNMDFVGNQANNGGAIYTDSPLTLNLARFKGNQANNGGAIYGRSITATTSLFSGNYVSARGGAMYSSSDGLITLLNVTLASNQAGNEAGAIYTVSSLNHSLTNVILWQNGNDTNATPFNNASSYSLDYSVVQGGCPAGATCNNVQSGSVLFVDGPDPSVAPTQNGDFRLLPGSSAIDAGINSGAPATDLQGLSRPINGTVDAGAYESQGFSLSYTSGSEQITNIGASFSSPLQVTIISNGGEPVGPGGEVTFAGPTTGASLFNNTATGQSDGAGLISTVVNANSAEGTYSVVASANGASGTANFVLTNTQAVLVLSKAVQPNPAAPGATVTYTLSFTNEGLSAISGVVITDYIPSQLTVQTIISGGDVTISHTASTTASESFALAPLAPSDSGIITLTAQLNSPLVEDVLQNTATITSPNISGGATELVAVDLNILNVSPAVNPATFGVTENAADDTPVGSVTASDVNSDTLSYSISGGNPGLAFKIDSLTGDIAVNDGLQLDYESQNQYLLNVSVSDGGLTSTVIITVNLSDEETDLTLDKTFSGYPVDYLAQPGSPLTYTLSFANIGIDTATSVVITDFLPTEFNLSGFDFVVDNGGSITQTGTSPLAFSVSNLAGGQSGSITLTGQVGAGVGLGTFTNTAIITSATPDVDTLNNQVALGVEACASAIAVQNGNADGPGSLYEAVHLACEGGTITFAGDMTITISDTGDGLTNFSIDKALTIDGGSNAITIEADSYYFDDMFTINTSEPVALRSLTLSRGPGGVIMAPEENDVTLDNITLSDNYRSEGGFIFISNGELTINNSRFISNTANWAPVLAAFNSVVVMSNTLIAHNVMTDSAALDIRDTVMTVTHSTIVGNGSLNDYRPGNITTWDSTSQITLQHSILAGGIADGNIGQEDCSGPYTAASIIDAGHNLFGETCPISASTSSHISSTLVFEEVLGPLADYGDGQLSYGLRLGSPAIDGGQTGPCLLDTDPRGITRPQGTACDIGAFESQGFSLNHSGNNQSTLISTQFGAPLALTLSSGDGTPLVEGYSVIFNAPLSGPSLTTATFTATTNSAGQVSVPVYANGTAGSYSVQTQLDGWPTLLNFNLTNALPQADVWVSKQLASPAITDTLNQAITYTLHFGNQGQNTAENVSLSDALPSQFALSGFSYSLNNGGSIVQTGSAPLSFDISDLALGHGGTITLSGILSDASVGVFSNTANIATSTSDGDTSNNQSEVGLSVPNFAPVLGEIETQTLTETQMMTVTLVATDTNNDSLSYSLLNAPPNMIVSPAGVINWQPTESGEDAFYVVTVMVSDGTLTGTQELYISVSAVNEAPVILIAPEDQSVAEGETASFTILATDADKPQQTLLYSLSSIPAGASFNGGTFTWPTTESDGPGVYPLTVFVSDGLITVSHSLVITVAEINKAPQMASLNDVSVNEGQTINFTPVVTDTDDPAQTLSFSLSSLPGGASFDTATGAFNWVTTEADDGLYPLTLSVSDGYATISQSLVISVGEISTAPVLGNLSDLVVTEGQTATFTANASDADLPAQNLRFSLSQKPGSAVIGQNSGLFVWPTNDNHGGSVYPVTVIVSDGLLTDSQTINISVNEVNEAPLLPEGLTDRSIWEGNLLTLNATATDADIPAQSLSYSLSNAPAGMNISNAGIISWPTTEADGPAVYNITVTVSDGVANTSKTIAITVTEINQAPVVAPLSDITVNEGDSVTFSVTASDADLPAPTLNYGLETNTPISATLSQSGVFSWTTDESHGDEVFALTISVGDGVITLSQSINITVTEVNQPPLLAPIPPQTVPQTGRVNFGAVASDADDPPQTLRYSLSNAPAEASIGETSGDFSWQTSITNTPGAYQATVLVSDEVVTVSQIVDITISPDNDAPLIAEQPIRTVLETEGITFTVVATDDESQFLTFTMQGGSLSAIPAGPFAPVMNDEGDFIWHTTANDGPGIYTATVLVSDSLLTSTSVITVAVLEGTQPPITGTKHLYLPLILQNFSSGPDLIIETLAASSNQISMTIRNAGNKPATNPFWIDVYFDPIQPPQINQLWNDLAPAGAVWAINQTLQPGETLNLSVGDAFYHASSSSNTFVSEVNVYAYIDALNYETSYGSVLEYNEENNLFGPIISSAKASITPTISISREVSIINLPNR